MLLLRPQRAYLPYPSCPVPAAGPFRGNFSLTGALTASAAVFGFLENRPNRPVNLLGLALTGVGIRFGISSRVASVSERAGFPRSAASSEVLELLLDLAISGVRGSLDEVLDGFERIDDDRVINGAFALPIATLSELEATIAAFSTDSRRVWPVVAKRLRLLCITGTGCKLSSIGVPSLLGLGGGCLT